jgi:diacylglycerol kinase (ATP)
VPIPKNCRSLKFFNIRSGQAGIDFWGSSHKGFGPSEVGDGLIEIVSTSHILHDGLQRIGAGKITRLAQVCCFIINCCCFFFFQARNAVVRVFQPVPIQVDGESWTMQPCEVKVDLLEQIPVLEGPRRSKGIAKNNVWSPAHAKRLEVRV